MRAAQESGFAPLGADAYDVVADDTDRVTATEPVAIDIALADLFAPPR